MLKILLLLLSSLFLPFFLFSKASNPPRIDTELFQTCLSAPNSEGCKDCKENGDTKGSLCEECELLYKDVADGKLQTIYDIQEINPSCVDPLLAPSKSNTLMPQN